MTQRPTPTLLIGTFNQGKIKEIGDALTGLRLNLRSAKEFPAITAIEESGSSYRENAVLKAASYFQQTGLMTLADDSGLEVDALGGRPGVFSARYGGNDVSDEQRVTRLLSELDRVEDRRARFICVIALVESGAITTFEDCCEGTLSLSPKGHNGFGYDPIFIPRGYANTFGELPASIKDVISHRGKALAQLRKFLADRLLDHSWNDT